MKEPTFSDQPAFIPPVRPLLFVLSGPSGVGKDAVLAGMKASGYPLEFIVTLTTRPRRATERDGVDYHFVSGEKFQEMLQNGELLESAEVYGHWYGVPKAAVKQALERGRDVMLKVDVQGVANIRNIVPQAVTIFLMPSSMEELESRLRRRRTESSLDLSRRLKLAREEMRDLSLFDYVVFNRKDKMSEALADIKAIITAEKRRVKPREISL